MPRADAARRAALAVLAAIAAAAASAQGPTPPRAASAPAGPRTGFDALIGGWSRTDGNYHIVVRSVGPDGRLDAMYFNPNPLPFASAQATRADGQVHARFVLEAGGYAGSTYALRWDASTDRLVGSFHQAVARQTYEVVFMRR